MGKSVVSIYTGNTWLHPHCRGMNLVPKLGMRCWFEAMARWPFRTHYWFFGSNSYKSYLTIARNLVDYYPSRHEPVPEWEAQYMAHLAQEIYQADIDPQTFVYATSGGRSFREFDAGIEPALKDDLDVLHFTQLNPGFAAGDKLMCLGPLTFSNWRKIVMRAIRRALRR